MGLMQIYSDTERRCATYQKPASSMPNGTTLRTCGNCSSAYYCSRRCQRDDRPTHRQWCGVQGISAVDVQGRELDKIYAGFTQGIDVGNRDPPRFIRNATWLNTLEERDAMKMLVDSYRMRIEDESKIGGHRYGLYAQEDPVPDFRAYLEQAERKGGILPQWWNAEKKEECVNYGASEEGGLHSAVTKDEIIDEYQDRLMPMRARMISHITTGVKVGLVGMFRLRT